jgi:hypothetical protein
MVRADIAIAATGRPAASASNRGLAGWVLIFWVLAVWGIAHSLIDDNAGGAMAAQIKLFFYVKGDIGS